MENVPQSPSQPQSQPPYTPPQAPSKHSSGLRDVISTIAIIVAAPILALLLTAFVFQAYEVDGPSMNSTLQNNDRLIVLKVPRTWSRITHHAYIPKRYDIVVFNHHDDYGLGQPSDKQLIKRVIGLPGDRVVIDNNSVMIYNTEHPSGFSPDTSGPNEQGIQGLTKGHFDQTIPAGEIFVMGDNRENSLDSRAFGTVQAKDIVGKLSARIFPFNDAERF